MPELLSRLSRSPRRLIFVIVLALGLGWALYTGQAWEDYYITYRSAQNLVAGHGLVFTPGERLHTFTSPLGVLLPALACALTGNRSDAAALWFFRAMSAAAFAGAAVLVWRLAEVLARRRHLAWWLVGALALDAKALAFSNNGMETGFLLLFFAWSLWALVGAERRRAVHLGLAWAGLMWCRPDSFVYIGALGLAVLVFRPGAAGGGRIRGLREMLAGGGLAAVLYLPWFAWAWWYYGTPVPHTVVAKGLGRTAVTLPTLGHWLVEFPGRIATGASSLAATFVPPYALTAGWPPVAIGISFLLALGAALAWAIPMVRWPGRMASAAFLAGHFYLTFFPNYPFPWYLPVPTLLAAVVIFVVADQVLDHLAACAATQPEVRIFVTARRTVNVVLVALLAGAAGLTLFTAEQARLQQELIENGLRRPIGLWLGSQAKSKQETVFLEPLGYVGFFSGLKMYDWPGLASREMVAARRRLANRPGGADYWPGLIRELRPDWLVLRGAEAADIRQRDAELLNTAYEALRVFDAREAVSRYDGLPGMAYLHFDERWVVFHRRGEAAPAVHPPGRLVPIALADVVRARAYVTVHVVDAPQPGTLFAHAPSVLAVAVPRGAFRLRGAGGFQPGAFADPKQATDGAQFTVELVGPDGGRRPLFDRFLDPVANRDDRAPCAFALELPPDTGGMIEFTIGPGPAENNSFDWTYWTGLAFEVPAN